MGCIRVTTCATIRLVGASGDTLAADVLGDDDQAQEIYQRLKFKTVAGPPHEE